jgi:hypothetical protein
MPSKKFVARFGLDNNNLVISNVANPVLITDAVNKGITDSISAFAQQSYNQANTSTSLAQAAFDKANAASSLSGLQPNAILFANNSGYTANDTNNLAFFIANNTLVTSNIKVPTVYTTTGGIVFPDGTTQSTAGITSDIFARNTANSASSNTIYTQGVDATQNNRLTSVEANTVYLSGALTATNNNLSTANTFLQSQISTKLSKSGDTMTGSLNISNTSSQALYVAGSVYFNQDLNVTGNIYLNGSATTLSSNNVSFDDSLIYLASNNITNTMDIGMVGHFTTDHYQHTGVVRDHIDGKWKFFSNVSTEPALTVNFSEANTVYDTIKVGGIDSPGTLNILNTTTVLIANTKVSTSNTTGALIVSGGVGVTGNINATGSLSVYNGLYSTGQYSGSYSDGVVVDYVYGNGRISVGSNDGITFYNNGPGGNVLANISTSGILYANGVYSNGYQVLTTNSTINISASQVVSGVMNVNILGTGTANANTYLRGDGSWATIVQGTGGGGGGVTPGGPVTLNSSTVTQNVTFGVGNNGLSVGPLTITPGFYVSIPSFNKWVIL